MTCDVAMWTQPGVKSQKIEYHLRLFFSAVFKWLSKVLTCLRLLRLMIGLKDSRKFFNQWEAKPKPIAPRTRDFYRASSELQVIARNSDLFKALFVPVVIGQSDYFGLGFSTVIWKPLYSAVVTLLHCDISIATQWAQGPLNSKGKIRVFLL